MKHLPSLLGFLLVAVFLQGEENNAFLSYYDTEIINITYQSYGGLTLTLRGKSTGTQMGIDSSFELALKQYEDSARYLESYQQKNTAGNIFIWGGLGVLMASSFYPILAMDPGQTTGNFLDDYKVAIGLYAGGLISTLIGSFLLPASFQDLTLGVNAFNRNKVSDFQ